MTKKSARKTVQGFSIDISSSRSRRVVRPGIENKGNLERLLTQTSCVYTRATITAARFGEREVGVASDELTDRLGSVASTMCAIHCAICAFLPVIFTAVGLNFLLNQSAEWIFSLVAIAFGLGALVLGWRRHRSKTVAALLVLGVVGILASRGLEMGSDHHGHDDAHHEEAVADGAKEHHDEADHDEHGEAHGEHDDGAHTLGAVVGVLAGTTLLFGHLLNIRAFRRRREEVST